MERIDHVLFIHLSTGGHLGPFCLSATVNNVAMNMGVQTSVQVPAFNIFEYIPKNGIVGSYGNPMFSFLRNYTFQ